MKTAYVPIKCLELMNTFRKGQAGLWKIEKGIKGEARLITEVSGYTLYS